MYPSDSVYRHTLKESLSHRLDPKFGSVDPRSRTSELTIRCNGSHVNFYLNLFR